MRLRSRRVGLALLVLLIAVQFFPVDRRNPSADPSKSINVTERLPLTVQTVFRGSCVNCHSYQTRWPWYSYLAPASWIIARDVREGRKKMNFSEWGSYSAEKREQKLEEICEQVTNGDMPDPKYLFFHRRARPTQQQREAVCEWTEASRQY